MISTLFIFGFATIAQAHYRFEKTIYDGNVSESWEYIREIDRNGRDFPELDAGGENITCNRMNANPFTKLNTKTLEVTAGSTIGFEAPAAIFHPGPLQFYLAKAPSRATVKDFDGKGDVWFKIFSNSPTVINERLTWPNMNKKQIEVTIPRCIEDGEYLLRVEHIGLHDAYKVGGAQFFLSCAQIKVTGGTGQMVPPNMLAFPGSYDPESKSLHIHIYYPIPTNYTAPCGPVMKCADE